MKNIISILCGLWILTLTGCDFLEVVPDNTATLDDAFKNEEVAERFLYTCYSFQYDFRTFRSTPGKCTTNELIGETRWGDVWFPYKNFNRNEVGSTFNFGTDYNQWRDIWLDSYQGIRQCHNFLDNIDRVKPQTISVSTFEQYKQQWIGEAIYLLAFYHHQLFQNYGPIVIMDIPSLEQRPRSNVDESVNQIVAWYDEAISLLPAIRPQAELGRANQMMAKALKAQLLLYAASPLFNGDPENVFANADPKFKELMNLTYDASKWSRALTAIEEAISFAEQQGGRTLYKWTGNDPVTGAPVSDPQRQAYLNLRNLAVEPWNSECVVGFNGNKGLNYNANNIATSVRIETDEFERHAVPKALGGRRNTEANPVGGLSPTLAAVKIFYSANGLPLESDPNRGYDWTAEGRMTVPQGENTCNLHLNREQRFYAAIGYDGGIYEYNNWQEEVLNFKRGLNTDDQFVQGLRVGGNGTEEDVRTALLNQDRSETGYAPKKLISPKGISNATTFTVTPNMWAYIRLGDLYLQYVEAYAAINSSLNDRAKGYIKQLHDRAGLNGDSFYFRDYSGDALTQAIRRERMIEMIFERHWHWDLNRWEMRKKWHDGQMWCTVGYPENNGFWGLNIAGADNESFYEERNQTIIGQFQPMNWNDRMLFLPIGINHVNVNILMVQNPGY